MQYHPQNNNRKIIFFLSQLEHDYVVAFSYAVYLTTIHYQSNHKLSCLSKTD